MPVSQFNKKIHPERHGTSLWFQVYNNGLIRSGWVAERGSGNKGDPKMVVLLRVPEQDED